MTDVFKALADPTRRHILDELTERSPQTLFELCSRLTMRHGVSSSRQAISQHLGVLEDAGLVVARREGRCKLHVADSTPLRQIVERWLDSTASEAPTCASISPPSSSTTRRRRSASTPTSSASGRRRTSRSASTAG